MSFIAVRQPLTRQSIQAAEVDPQYGATVVLTGDLRRNLARPQLPVTVDTTGLTFGRATARGQGVGFSGAATGGGFIATVPSDAPALTSIFVASIAGSGGGGLGRLFNQATGHDLFYNAGGSFLAYQVSYSTTAAQWQFSQSTSADLRCFVFSCDGPAGTAPLFYVDGGKRTHFNSQSPSGTRSVGGASYGVGRVTSGTGRFHNGTIALAAFLPYAASEGLAQSLSANPWQIFRPTRRVFYSIPSDGPTTFTGDATEAATPADVLSVVFTGQPTFVDTGASADIVAVAWERADSVSEAAAAVDVVSPQAVLLASLAEEATASDATSVLAVLLATVAEESAAASAATAIATMGDSALESSGALDAISTGWTANVEVIESCGAADFIAAQYLPSGVDVAALGNPMIASPGRLTIR